MIRSPPQRTNFAAAVAVTPVGSGETHSAWQKVRIDEEQELVIGGYMIAARTFDALIFGHYPGEHLLYAGRTRRGLTPALRQQVFNRFRGLETAAYPLCEPPGKESRPLGRRSHRNRQMRYLLAQSANAAVRAEGIVFRDACRGIVPRQGHAKAIWAIAHKLCRMI